MPTYTATLERTVTSRETGALTIDAANLGAAERMARERVRNGTALEVRWRREFTEAGRIVVVDVEERRAVGKAA